MRRRAALALVVAVAVAGAAAAGLVVTRIRGRPDVQVGAERFRANCAACHGVRGEGNFPAPPLNAQGHAHHHPDWELYAVISEGKVGLGEMPAWRGRLSEREIRSMIAYLKTLWTPDQRLFQEEVTRARPRPPQAP